MGDFLQLGLHRSDDLGMIVADVQHTDAADEVQVALAVHIPQLRALGPVDDQRVSGDQATWHESITLTEQTWSFFDFTVHGISHREPRPQEAVAVCSQVKGSTRLSKPNLAAEKSGSTVYTPANSRILQRHSTPMESAAGGALQRSLMLLRKPFRQILLWR
ncbi:hypothetical protein PBDP_3679 [Pseudomonas sp. St290]|nr:hypothetical protein PBDP_3679 [Pseudomonas sp. St290]